MIRRCLSFVQREFERLVRFGICGFLSWLLYFFMYTLLSRFLWESGDRNIQNFIAVGFASVFNFFAHRRWTFRSHGKHWKEIFRYVSVMIVATLIEMFLFWFGHSYLGIYDFIVVVVAAGIVAVFTYGCHRYYTFHHQPPQP
ncbi:GtrA family protein [Candidatus Uhrbacteria bacterium]|nr:GtrA family protein [Candidatus Uhrbacteria bacterium]